MTRILIVDDHPSVLEGTKIMLEQEPDLHVTVETSAAEALRRLQEEAFDVLLFDLYMSELNGLELAKRVLETDPEAKVLIYTGFDIAPHVNLLIESGVTGFISKTTSQEQLITAIRCALRGEAVIPLSLLRELRRVGVSITEEEREIRKALVTDKERVVLQELGKGKSNKEIAQILHMSQRSLEYCLTHLFQKLGVRSRVEAVVKAREQGLLAR